MKPASPGGSFPHEMPPCRLFFLFARASPAAVVFRRGPSRWVQTIGWNTKTDEFVDGQWFHGRIYERRCDLSPSGHLMVYFASKPSRQQQESDYTYSWTAVSKPPWLVALGLWPKGDCWSGGGMFEDDRKLLLNHPEDLPHANHSPRGHLTIEVRHHGGEDSPLFAHRAARDGWVQEEKGRWQNWRNADPPQVWVRRQPNGEWDVVRKLWGLFNRQSGFLKAYNETFALRRPDRAVELPLHDAEWADWDQQGRLVFARRGKLLAASVDDAGRLTYRVLAEFNLAKPSPVAAPPAARRWR